MIITSSTSKYTLSTVVTESKITTTIVKTTQTSQIEGRCWNLDGVPSDLVLTVDSYEQISGEFVINSTNHIGHKVYISDDNITFTLLTTLTGAQNSFVASGLTPDTIYYFKVVAYKVDITSPYELTGNAQTEAVQPITINSITVVWDNINDEFDITVDATGGTGVYTVIYTQNLNILNVVVTDTIGTTANQDVNLDDISPIVINSATYEIVGNEAIVTIIASGGFGDLTYQLGAQTNSTGIFTVNQSDTYAITVSDEGGATPATSSIEIMIVDIPDLADALFVLNSISGDNMVDAVNGWLFPINNKDWDSDDGWINLKSLPFKTLATISPPADGTPEATLIQFYDVDNFWYQSNGTPNQIPIQAFFQNINFSNRYFCKWFQRETNANLNETYPESVGSITLYKTARTITAAYTNYYGADVERPTTNVMFVSPNGNDTTGDGSFASPFKTIDKGLIALPTTHTLWVFSGVYNEASSGYDYLRLSRNSTVLNVRGAGNCVLRSVNATYITYVNSTSQNVNWKNFIIDGEGIQKQLYLNKSGSNYDYCKFINGRTGNTGLGSFTNNSVIGNAAFGIATGLEYVGVICNGVFTANTSAQNKITVKYSKFTNQAGNGLLIGTLVSSTDALYNVYKTSGYGITVANCRCRTTDHIFNIQRSVFKCKNTGAFINPTDISATSKFKLKANFNKFMDDQTSTSVLTYGINATGASAIWNGGEIEKNYFESSNTGLRYGITINPSAAIGVWKTNYNRAFQDSFDGALIFYGEGATGECDGSEIIGNYLRGCLKNYPAQNGVATTHGILANGGINFTIKYNRVDYTPLGIVVKANAGEQYTGGGVFYNVLFENAVNYYWRRVGNLKAYNNTCVNNLVPPQILGEIDDQGYEGSCRNSSFKNNIFKGNAEDYIFAVDPNGLDGVGDIVWDNNLFDTDQSLFIFDFLTNYYTFAQAASNGWYINGDLDTANFNDLTNGNLWLNNGSAGLGDGTNLGVTYEDGLDINTNWNITQDGDVDNYPVIVTKKQTATWNKGAYVN